MNNPAKRFRRILKRNLCKILAIGCMAAFSIDTMAVTEGEMNQAQAIAAKYYIRYVNNGSGYLDNFTPTSMSELESKLANDKDRESFKEFKKSTVATNYASWDKDKLVEYWSITFFKDNASHLDSKGANNGEAKLKIKKGVSAIAVAAPAPVEPAAPEANAGEAENSLQAEEPVNDPLAEAAVEEKMEETAGEIDALKDSIDAEEEEYPVEEKKSSGTWVYIMILAILVAVVVILVAYASRTMRAPKNRPEEEESGHRVRSGESNSDNGYGRGGNEDAKLREKYAQNLASKSEEIMQLSRQLTDMELLAAQLKEENRRLRLEIEDYRSRAERPVAPLSAHGAAAPRAEEHEVYLGRVNAKGIFVRADRQPVEGQSIYRLSTVDGISGTFSVIRNSLLDRQLLSDPEKWLSGGCTARDLYDTDGRYGIYTEHPGTAVFKDGAWRVERKSRIRYE